MAKKKHTVVIEQDVKGGAKLNKATQETEKHTKAIDRKTKAQQRSTKADVGAYNATKQGVIATAPAAKNFSKMSRAMDGGTGAGGLVRAYALLAANVFALTAAFGVLSRAAQVDTLMESMRQLEVVTGNSVRVVGMELQKVSGYGMDLAESMRATSLAMSAGFDSSAIKDLGEVARNAAVSLGRPMGDALDRIFRGVIKVEPELLDEIGLFVRVKDASAKYASELGIAATELTEFQKRQAFANEAIKQGQDKFQAFQNIKTDQFSQLAAVFSDMAQSILSVVNWGLKPLVSLLTGSKAVLAGLFLYIAVIIGKKAVPALGLFATSAAESAQEAIEANQKYKEDINSGVNSQRKAAEDSIKIEQDKAKKRRDILMKARKDTGVDFAGQTGKGGKALQAANEKLNKKNLQGQKKILALEEKRKALLKSRRAINYDAIEDARDALLKEIKAEEKLLELAKQRRDVKKKFPMVEPESGRFIDPVAKQTADKLEKDRILTGATANVVTTAEFKGVRAGFKELKTQYKEIGVKAKEAGVKIGVGNKALFAVKGAGQLAAVGIQSLQAAIGTLMMGLGLLIPAMTWIMNKMDVWDAKWGALDEATKKTKETLKDMTLKIEAQAKAMAGGADGTRRWMDANLAMNKTIMNTTGAVIAQKQAFVEWQAEAGGAARLWDGIKSIWGGDMESKLVEAEKGALKGMVKGFGEMDAAVLENFKHISEVGDVMEAQKKHGKDIKDSMKEEAALNDKIRRLRDEEARNMETHIVNGHAITELNEHGLKLQKERLGLQKDVDDKAEARKKVQSEIAVLEERATNALFEQGVTMEDINESATEAANAAENMKSILDGAKDIARDYANSFITSTAVDKPLAAFNQLSAALLKDMKNMELGDEQRANLTELLKKDNEAILSLLSAQDRQNLDLIKNEKDLERMVKNTRDRYEEQQAALIKSKTEMAQILNLQKQLKPFAKRTAMFAEENQALTTRNLELKKQEIGFETERMMNEKNVQEFQYQYLAAKIEANKLTEEDSKLMETLQVTTKDIYEITAQKNKEEAAALNLRIQEGTASLLVQQEEQKILKQRVAEFEKLLQLETKNLELRAKLEKFSTDGTTKLNTTEQMNMMIEAEQKRVKLANTRYRIEMELIRLEFALLEKRLDIIAEEKNWSDETRAKMSGGLDTKTLEEAMEESLRLGMENSQLGFKVKLIEMFSGAMFDGFSSGLSRVEDSQLSGRIQSIGAGGTLMNEANQRFIAVATAEANLEKARADLAADDKTGGIEGTQKLIDAVLKASADLTEAEEATLGLDQKAIAKAAVFETTTNELLRFSDAVKDLGDAGPIASAVAEFAVVWMDGMKIMEESTATGVEKTIEKLKFAASAIQGIGAIAKASSDARVAAIDKEIDAEKKRDGKTKESQQRIYAMEKKKEAASRKAFAIQKAVMLAQTAISTSAAIMAALAPPPLGFGPALGAPLATAMGIMGAVQMAMIASQQYGGFTATKPDAGSDPAAISVGKRGNKVDVSQRVSGGELAYLTGQKGVGSTANSFIPHGGAAGLRKGYASGGVIVGERGPEMIYPSSGYQVTPNDAMGGKPVNAHFTINAIDAAGVEEVLLEQQGNIISMIRQAANSYGEDFIESVNTDHLAGGTPKSAGGVDY